MCAPLAHGHAGTNIVIPGLMWIGVEDQAVDARTESTVAHGFKPGRGFSPLAQAGRSGKCLGFKDVMALSFTGVENSVRAMRRVGIA